jgi:hypothetical protein
MCRQERAAALKREIRDDMQRLATLNGLQVCSIHSVGRSVSHSVLKPIKPPCAEI